VELLSQTMISVSQPRRAKLRAASCMLRNEAAMSFSSLNAGTMTEIFIPSSLPRSRRAGREVSGGNIPGPAIKVCVLGQGRDGL
jgi:hypothetical protein